MSAPSVSPAVALRPILMAVAAAAVWGLWWIPIRWLEALGLSGALGGVAMSGGATLSCLVWVLAKGGAQLSPRALFGACFVGMAVSSYSASINHSDVVRVVLLFYLAPAWSKLIEWAIFGMPWRWTSSVALGCAGIGAYLVLGGNLGGLALNFGDVLALLSGIAWALGAALIFSDGKSDAMGLTLGTSGFAMLMGGLLFVL
ncbi:MAG: EamA family transporter, partial [Arenibacterium sp.]